MTPDFLAAAKAEHKPQTRPRHYISPPGLSTSEHHKAPPTPPTQSPTHLSHPPARHLCHSQIHTKTKHKVALTTADENTGSTKAMLITSTSCGNTEVVPFFPLFLMRASLCCPPARLRGIHPRPPSGSLFTIKGPPPQFENPPGRGSSQQRRALISSP